MQSDDIDKLLFKYYSIKEKMKDYEEYLKKVKEKIEGIIEYYDVENLKSDNFEVIQKKMTTRRICKSDLPRDIYDEYSREITFKTLQVMKRGEKPKRRSRSRS
jgi:hypothetical protein